MQKELFKAKSRGHENYGWLDTYYSFSFAGYYNPKRLGFGALRVLNDDTILGGGGFPFHHHSNMEIVTIPLSGALEHKDTLGEKGVIGEDEVQAMSAGAGIIHSEFNHSKTEPLSLLQIWILPEKNNIPPRYDKKKFDLKRRKNNWQLLVSPNNPNALQINQDAHLSIADLGGTRELSYKTSSRNNGVFIFVITGTVSIFGETLSQRDALGIFELTDLQIKATENSSILAIEVPLI